MLTASRIQLCKPKPTIIANANQATAEMGLSVRKSSIPASASLAEPTLARR